MQYSINTGKWEDAIRNRLFSNGILFYILTKKGAAVQKKAKGKAQAHLTSEFVPNKLGISGDAETYTLPDERVQAK